MLLIVSVSSTESALQPGTLRWRLCTVLAWGAFFFNCWLLLALIGALGGLVIGSVIGLLWDPADIGFFRTTFKGMLYGTEWVGKVWGIGVSLVLCFIKLMNLHRRGQKMLEGPVWPRF